MEAGFGSIGIGGEAADNEEFLAVRRKRHESFTELIRSAFAFGLPLLLIHAQRVVDKSETANGRSSGEALGAQRRDHGIEQGQRQTDSRAAQEGAPWKVFSGNDHDPSLVELRAPPDVFAEKFIAVIAHPVVDELRSAPFESAQAESLCHAASALVA